MTLFDTPTASLFVTLLARFECRGSDFDQELIAELRLLAEHLEIDYRRGVMSAVN